MKVLVTGVDGYLGCLTAPLLASEGHLARGLDTGYYRAGWLYNGSDLTVETRHKDIRQVDRSDLEGIDAVVHMAELSNDPLGTLSPAVTYAINHKGSVRLAQLAKQAGVERFVYMSSCSVYGVAADDFVTEDSEVNPQTTYAECKTLVEKELQNMAEQRFSPVIMRNATAYGASPRMRFDIVLNNLCGLAWATKEIRMTSDGSPWRPIVHALDIGKAISCALDAPRDKVHNQIFNVGDTDHNYQVRQIAEIVAEVFPECQLSFGPSDQDNRSYRVSFEKIHRLLPDFHCDWDALRGAEQLLRIFRLINMPRETFDSRCFTRLKQLQYLLDTNQIDQNFYWVQ